MNNGRDNKSTNESLPLIILLNKIKKIPNNIQKNMELFFVINGYIFVTINNKRYKLDKSDVILINNGDSYQIDGEAENLVLSLEIEYDFLNSAVKREQIIYVCNSSINKNNKYDDIRKMMFQIMYEYSNKENKYELKMMSMLYKLIYLLNTNFLLTESEVIQNIDIQNSKYDVRVNNILSYIKQNYYRQISLQDIANSQYLTPEYLSKFFKAQIGMTFSRYLNEFRLSQALKELIHTDNSVTKIAMNNGFPNLVSFNKIFREIYNTTPAEYRSEIKKKQSNNTDAKKLDSQIINVDYNQVYDELTKYVATEQESNFKDQSSSSFSHLNVSADINTQKELFHTWKNLINLGYASDGLRSDLQQHLTDIQNSTKFRYARFQEIFSDEMLNSGEYEESENNYNFNKIDKLIDFLYSIGLKPFIEFSQKDKVLNIDADKILYNKPANIKQRSLKESLVLLEKFIIHCVNRYGLDEVSQWYFEIWKEGEIEHIFWNGNFDRYISTFEEYYKIIKQLVPNAKVGGPGINPELNINYLGELLNQFVERGVIPDFISIILFTHELIQDSSTKNINSRDENKKNIYKNQQENYTSRLFISRDKNYVKSNLNKIRKILNLCNVNIPELHITEWNSTISHRHPAHDTTFKGAFIIKNIVDNLDEADSFGYWFCSDVSGELKDSKTLLYGEMGLINLNGIKKSGFYAFEMLSKLGNKLIDKGDGYIITSKFAHNYEIITYNYKHYSNFYCLSKQTKLNLNQYYSIFENNKDLHIYINLQGVKNGRYRVRKYTLNRRHGSIFDEWLNMNTVYNLRKSEIEYLKQICIPKQTIFYLENVNNELKIESNLEPHEVNLYEIALEYDMTNVNKKLIS